jgi:hypothetical protein
MVVIILTYNILINVFIEKEPELQELWVPVITQKTKTTYAARSLVYEWVQRFPVVGEV